MRHGPWMVATSLFVHADVWDILANMLTLYFFSSYLHDGRNLFVSSESYTDCGIDGGLTGMRSVLAC
ncbi:MAG: rhomboid family intramembrane serine protease [Chloroflexi bacterium]|nr:rhomboid family intramembrane serine protease [Chloroflexota bacterium]